MIYHMSRSVVSNTRILACQQPHSKNINLAAYPHVIFCVEVRKYELGALPLLGNCWNQDYQCKDTYNPMIPNKHSDLNNADTTV